MKRLQFGIAGLAVLAGVGVALWWLSRPRLSAEEQIANTIIEIKRAVETKDAGGVLKYIDHDYNDGTYERKDLTQFLVGGFRTPEEFRVEVRPPEVSVSGNESDVRLQAVFSWGAVAAEDQRRPLSIVAHLRKTGGTWKVVKAAGWEPAMAGGQ